MVEFLGGGASNSPARMSTIANPVQPLASMCARGGTKTKTKPTKKNKCASITVAAGPVRDPADINARNKRLNREVTTNTKRAGSSSHKAQNGPPSADAQEALRLKRAHKNQKSKEQRLRRARVEVDELAADIATSGDRTLCLQYGTFNDSHVIDIESASSDAAAAPVQYTYTTARLYTRSAPEAKNWLSKYDALLAMFVFGSFIIWDRYPAYLSWSMPLVPILVCRFLLFLRRIASRNVYDPKSLVVDPQNLRPHRNTVVDHSLVGDQMAIIGYTSHSDVTICVEVYDHFLSKKVGMKFSDRTFQNLMTEAFYVFPKPRDGVVPIPIDVLENTSYVFGQYLLALQMRSKYHLPLTLEPPVPIFQKADWWNPA